MKGYSVIICLIAIVNGSVFSFADARTKSVSADRMMEILRKNIDTVDQKWRLEQHEIYRRNNPEKQFQRGSEFRISDPYSKSLYRSPAALAKKSSSVDKLLILANKTLYDNAVAKEKIDRYIEDITSSHGCTVVLETLEGGKPADIKSVIKEHYDNGGLDGAVQIGKLPAPWYESDNDPTTRRYDDFTCDLYYMDLDGNWGDKDKNGKFDSHTAGEGTLGIEIFYARIDCSTMGSYGNEIELLSEYMDKLHNYYLGKITLHKSALGYLDHDWASSDNYLNTIYPTSNENELIRWSNRNTQVNRNDYLNNRLQKNYSALHMWCHAGWNAHSHHTGGNSSMDIIYKSNPKPIAYFQDGCHVSDFAAGTGKAFLGGCYVFNKSPTALLCLSGSRSGQWLGLMAKDMFEEIGKNTCIGKAFKIWFAPYQNRSEKRDKQNFIGWNYGYNIFGDPMITLVSVHSITALHENTRLIPTRALDVQCIENGRIINVSYTLSQKTPVDFDLLTVTGKHIKSLVSGIQNSGNHSAAFNSSALANGSYIISLKTSFFNDSRQITIVK